MPRSSSPPPPAPRGGSRRLVGAAIGFASALLAIAFRATPVGERLEYPFVDVRTRQHAGDRAPDPRIVVAQIVEEDADAVKGAYGQGWPWPLEFNAGMVRVLKAAGARALVVDVFHLDRGQGLDDYVGKAEIAPAVRGQIEGEAASADEYGAALKEFGPVALAFELSNKPAYSVPVRVAAGTARLGPEPANVPPRALASKGANFPVRRVTEGAAVLGYANVAKDLDGVVRRATVVGRLAGRGVRSLPLAAVGLLGVEAPTQPVDDDGTFLVDFRGAPGSTYSRVRPAKLVEWSEFLRRAAEVPDDAAKALAEAKEALQGKIVVLGVNLSGLQDMHPTSLAANYDGPEFQATVLDDLLNGGGRLYASPFANGLLVAFAAVVAGALGWASTKKWVAPLGAAVAAGAAVAFSWIAFGRGTCFDVASPVLGVVLAWGGTLTARSLTEGRYNRWLETTFSRYLAPSVIEALKNDPSLLELGGNTRELTVLFSDVAGFTTLSKRLGPQQIVRLLNVYLTAHCDAVFENGGVVDKFIGDAVVAFYGDPVPQGDHALRACRTALRVQERLPALRPLLAELGVEDFGVRLGLNSGTAVVGNMGSEQRFDYTCMGPTVNLASRLEGANKAFGTRILAGEETAKAAGPAVLTRPLARVLVVGDPEPVGVHEVLALRDAAPADLVAHAEAFARAQAAARTGDLDAADRALADAERLRPSDGPTAWFRALLAKLRSGSEPSPWSGVVTLKEK